MIDINDVLKKEVWYHGCTVSAWNAMISNKISATININSPRDFGAGFYMSCSEIWVKETYIPEVLYPFGKSSEEYYILEIPFCLAEKIKEYSLLVFSQQDMSFAQFVAMNRALPRLYRYNYDMVLGPMATEEQIEEGARQIEEKVPIPNLLSVYLGEDTPPQLVLHSQDICDTINLANVKVIPYRR